MGVEGVAPTHERLRGGVAGVLLVHHNAPRCPVDTYNICEFVGSGGVGSCPLPIDVPYYLLYL